jgi:hypothetical protein
MAKAMNKLLTRDQFREGVFERDHHKCVVCGEPAVDAHHILERRLWPDSGYYMNNGTSVCGQHHIECEMTIITVEQIREYCGIEKAILPPHLYTDQVYDKWGNPILPNGQRLKGELFHDESVQKILRKGRFLQDFTHHVKYPRTYHLPWSPGMNNDDRMMETTDVFEGKRIIVTEKMDGENTTMYNDHIHARSVNSGGHLSRDWVKNFWSQIKYDIPPEWRICGENLYAEHSIHYSELPTFFLGFSIWNKTNECLSWDDTLEYFELLNIKPVKVLYDGIYDEKVIQNLWNDNIWSASEGYVLRIADSFSMSEFRKSVSKFVRKGHILTTKHWMRGKPVVPNELTKFKEV